MEDKQDIELVNFVCDKCGRILAWTLPTAKVLCCRCNHWVKQQNIEQKRNAVSIKSYVMSVSR